MLRDALGYVRSGPCHMVAGMSTRLAFGARLPARSDTSSFDTRISSPTTGSLGRESPTSSASNFIPSRGGVLPIPVGAPDAIPGPDAGLERGVTGSDWPNVFSPEEQIRSLHLIGSNLGPVWLRHGGFPCAVTRAESRRAQSPDRTHAHLATPPRLSDFSTPAMRDVPGTRLRDHRLRAVSPPGHRTPHQGSRPREARAGRSTSRRRSGPDVRMFPREAVSNLARGAPWDYPP